MQKIKCLRKLAYDSTSKVPSVNIWQSVASTNPGETMVSLHKGEMAPTAGVIQRKIAVTPNQPSQTQDPTAEVPQGSVQGPTTFNCFINDHRSEVGMFTDDCTMVNSVDNTLMNKSMAACRNS